MTIGKLSRRDALLGIAGAAALRPGAILSADEPASPFLVRPYVQLGDAGRLARDEQLVLLWHAAEGNDSWEVVFRQVGAAAWSEAKRISSTRVAARSVPPHRVFEALLAPLRPSSSVDYRVRRSGEEVFGARARVRAGFDQPFSCVVAGDCGTGSQEQKRVAFQISRKNPDFVFVPGDLVYNSGLISEYRSSFFPVYSQDRASPEAGAPLLSSTVFLGGRGQHDTQSALDQMPDGHAFFLYWSFPLNGPALEAGGKHVYPLGGSPQDEALFRGTAGGRFPAMANYSFDWGNSHWTVLDTWNPNIDWTDPALRKWLADDLDRASQATWKFVSSYMPPFNSSTLYPQGQKMRVLADLFEAAGVDIVFSGYAHSYQRTYPLRFTPAARPAGPVLDPAHVIPGQWRLDRVFDGRRHTRPDGVLYIVSGCGGNPQLHSPEQTAKPDSWQPFTANYHASAHQFSLLEFDGPELRLRQISLDGLELVSLRITKA
jgi:acid phosphatase type 7